MLERAFCPLDGRERRISCVGRELALLLDDRRFVHGLFRGPHLLESRLGRHLVRFELRTPLRSSGFLHPSGLLGSRFLVRHGFGRRLQLRACGFQSGRRGFLRVLQRLQTRLCGGQLIIE